MHLRNQYLRELRQGYLQFPFKKETFSILSMGGSPFSGQRTPRNLLMPVPEEQLGLNPYPNLPRKHTDGYLQRYWEERG